MSKPRKKTKEKKLDFQNVKFKNGDGIEYEIIWKAPPPRYEAYGLCDDPKEPKPRILIDPTLKVCHLIEIITHEIAHAFFFEKSERAVNQFAKTIKKVIKQTGILS